MRNEISIGRGRERRIRGGRAGQGLPRVFSGPGTEELRGVGFGAKLDVAASASLLEQVLAMAGRDVGWQR
jgi:hypothetical protein